jgi:hypothetical protein
MAEQGNEWQAALAAIELTAIESLKTLKQEQDQLHARLKSMEELKANFAPPVYQRVREDYLRRLRTLEEQAAPLKQMAREQYARLRALLERFEADHEAVKLDQQELELRFKLGEFDQKEFERRSKGIETMVREKAEARARGLELKARFLEAFHAESELEASPAEALTTGRFATLGGADLASAEVRTHEVPTVTESAPPNKTQIMTAIPAIEPMRSSAAASTAVGGATQIFRAASGAPEPRGGQTDLHADAQADANRRR